MTPGLANGPPFPAKARKGAVVAIASLDSPSVPVAVGVCEIDVSSLQKVQGAKGVAVQTLQWSGDELWAWSPAGKPGVDAPGNIDAWMHDGTDEVEDVAQDMERVNLRDENTDSAGKASSSRDTNGDGESAGVEEDKEWTTQGTQSFQSQKV